MSTSITKKQNISQRDSKKLIFLVWLVKRNKK